MLEKIDFLLTLQKHCIQEWIKQESSKGQCPMCRQSESFYFDLGLPCNHVADHISQSLNGVQMQTHSRSNNMSNSLRKASSQGVWLWPTTEALSDYYTFETLGGKAFRQPQPDVVCV